MSKIVCNYCHGVINRLPGAGENPTCPHCDQDPGSPAEASRWIVTHQGERFGPLSWQRIATLALRGDLDPDAMLAKEGTTRWVRAATLRALFAPAPASAPAAPAAPPPVAKLLPTQPAALPTIAPTHNAVWAALEAAAAAVTGPIPAPEIRFAAPPPVPPIQALAPAITARVPTAAAPATRAAPPAPARGGSIPWLIEGLAAVCAAVLFTVSVVLGLTLLGWFETAIPNEPSDHAIEAIESPARRSPTTTTARDVALARDGVPSQGND